MLVGTSGRLSNGNDNLQINLPPLIWVIACHVYLGLHAGTGDRESGLRIAITRNKPRDQDRQIGDFVDRPDTL